MINYNFWISVLISYYILNLKKNKFSLENQIKYNDFADKRKFSYKCCSINNFNDVISNIMYAIGGLYQIIIMNNYYLGIFSILVSIGSAYYHLNPNMYTLFFDRFPMQIAFTYLIFNKIILTFYEKIAISIFSFGSLFYWTITYNILSYATFQLSLILYWLIFDSSMLIPIICYITAKICEDNDKYIFNYTNNIISGHTLKHIISGIALFFIN